ncbi:hypothetical protein LCGC14_0358040 [marine sediment metagenome]|uniref:Uncharacterized protein n=1 Tax=marine sediment metagenome TaxID=412755 RepID=A0A0F9WH02_9ZZZZ
MGYSCSVKADNVLAALLIQLQATARKDSTSNGWCKNGEHYFYEIGREQADGAITGKIWRTYKNLCYPAGPFKITHNGLIDRFPTSTKSQRESAMTVGLVKFHEVHGGGWKDDEVLAPILGGCSFVVI